MPSLILLFCRFVAIAVPPGQLSIETESDVTHPTVQVQPQAPPRTAPPARAKLSEDEVKEIDRIRQRLSPLNGTLFDDDDFADRLRKDFGQPNRPSDRPTRTPDRSHSIRSIRRRLAIIADDLDELGLHDAAEHAHALKKSLP